MAQEMKIVTSVSGGRTSAYLAANYPADRLVFSLVRIEDEACRFPDEVLRKRVEDRIQAPFIATAEYDEIVYTIFDLEQHIGKKIDWVTGPSFDELVQNRGHHYGGWLPNMLHRYCTTNMKIIPIFKWWERNFDEPVIMNLGYRVNELRRANSMSNRLNSDGLLEMTFENKSTPVPWQKPAYPLINDGVNRADIQNYWQPFEDNKIITFADYNNCVGCFNREPLFLRYMFDVQPSKMSWFARQEGGKKKFWKPEAIPYDRIRNLLREQTLFPTDFSPCDSGFCGI